MFEYLQIISGNKTKVGYVDYAIKDNLLSVKLLDLRTREVIDEYQIELSKISDFSKKFYRGWTKIEFTYQKLKFVFSYSGFGQYDYFDNRTIGRIVGDHQ